MKIAIYPGSFDPVTNGHLDVARRAASLFDKVYIAVAANHSKTPLFNTKERMQLIKTALVDTPNISVTTFEGLLVDFADAHAAIAIVRGLRAVTDFEYEFQMALVNHRLRPTVETVFLAAREEYTYISSSILKEVARLGGNITGLVPPHVVTALLAKQKPKLAAKRKAK
jgi:pantetheine-phosphate adenylyltransferase